ncbi:hypothetical protein [Streptomyces sp. NRRL S-378]|nr:hypothetical protein [Streptomyces sp. NRRL S-378]
MPDRGLVHPNRFSVDDTDPIPILCSTSGACAASRTAPKAAH